MFREFMVAVRVTIVTLVLTGLIYPFVITGLAQLLFPEQANGSVAYDEQNKPVGSKLIGQSFSKPGYFQPRPSAAGNGYDPLASSGSNLGATSQKLRDRIVADIKRLKKENPDAKEPIPAELVTASAPRICGVGDFPKGLREFGIG